MESVKILGNINLEIEYSDGKKENLKFKNSPLRQGKSALAQFVCSKDSERIWITDMIFGDGGVEKNDKKTVNPNRNTLFGVARVVKPVVCQLDPEDPTKVIVSTILEKDEGNDYVINEMALKLNTGDLFSMATFYNLNKNEQMKLKWTWELLFI